MDYKTKDIVKAVVSIEAELEVALQNFDPMNSPHEGWAVIKEEMDELWEHVRTWPKHDKQSMKKEAVQIGAMAIRFMLDCCKD